MDKSHTPRLGRSYVKKSIRDRQLKEYDDVTFTTTNELYNGKKAWIITPSKKIEACSEADCNCSCRDDECAAVAMGEVPDGVAGGIAGALVGSLVGGIVGTIGALLAFFKMLRFQPDMQIIRGIVYV